MTAERRQLLAGLASNQRLGSVSLEDHLAKTMEAFHSHLVWELDLMPSAWRRMDGLGAVEARRRQIGLSTGRSALATALQAQKAVLESLFLDTSFEPELKAFHLAHGPGEYREALDSLRRDSKKISVPRALSTLHSWQPVLLSFDLGLAGTKKYLKEMDAAHRFLSAHLRAYWRLGK